MLHNLYGPVAELWYFQRTPKGAQPLSHAKEVEASINIFTLADPNWVLLTLWTAARITVCRWFWWFSNRLKPTEILQLSLELDIGWHWHTMYCGKNSRIWHKTCDGWFEHECLTIRRLKLVFQILYFCSLPKMQDVLVGVQHIYIYIYISWFRHWHLSWWPQKKTRQGRLKKLLPLQSARQAEAVGCWHEQLRNSSVAVLICWGKLAHWELQMIANHNPNIHYSHYS